MGKRAWALLGVGQGGFESQVCFYPFIGGSSSIPTRSGHNPFANQVYFHSGPGKALCGAALRRYFREPPAVFRNQMFLMIDVFEFMMNEENGWKS